VFLLQYQVLSLLLPPPAIPSSGFCITFSDAASCLQYKMKFVYAHFPINYNVTDGPTGKNTILEIRNFIGEKLTRRITMQKGCIVERTANKDEIAITGNDLDMVAISAAQVTRTRSAVNAAVF
jgi:ribosomal protein L6P/L9E